MTANNHVFVTYLRLFLSFLKAFRILFIQFPNSDSQAKRVAIQRWSADTLSLLGIKVEVIGQLDTSSPQTCRMLVSNHVSWLDPLVIQTLQHSIFKRSANGLWWALLPKNVGLFLSTAVHPVPPEKWCKACHKP